MRLSGIWKQRAKRQASRNMLQVETLENRLLLASAAGIEPSPLAAEFEKTVEQPTAFIVNATGDVRPRIVNGQTTDDYPAVGIVNNGCTGTLISARHVLTAAHCVVGSTRGTFEMVGGTEVATSRIFVHPSYDDRNFDAGYDIAIMELNRSVEGIAPMRILRDRPDVGTLMTLVGFGEGGTSRTGSTGDFGTKRVGQTELEEVTNQHLFWVFDSHNEGNTAPGDSGGPAFIDVSGTLHLAGVTSGGGDAHRLGSDSFDTRVDVHASWIDGIVGDNTPPANPPTPNPDDHVNNVGTDATRITLNAAGAGSATGQLERAGDRDVFQFTIDASGTAVISATSVVTGEPDTYLRVYDGAGNLVAENDDFGGSLNSQVELNASAGTYYASVGAYEDQGTGRYRVGVDFTSDDDGSGNIFTNNTKLRIDDFAPSRVVSAIQVDGVSGTISDVNVAVDVQHSWVSDLRMILVSPSGTRVLLARNVGGDGDDFRETTFDDQASQSIRAGEAPFAGSFRPIRQLSRLNGEDANGRWRLVVRDQEYYDGGFLNGWSLTFQTDSGRANRRMAAHDAVAKSSDSTAGADHGFLAQALAEVFAETTSNDIGTNDVAPEPACADAFAGHRVPAARPLAPAIHYLATDRVVESADHDLYGDPIEDELFDELWDSQW